MKRGVDDARDFLNKLRDIFFLLGVNEIYD